MYPIYPLLSTIAAGLCTAIVEILHKLYKILLHRKDKDSKDTIIPIRLFVLLIVLAILVILFTCRVLSSYRNFSGEIIMMIITYMF